MTLGLKIGHSHHHLEAAVLASVGGHVTVVTAEHFKLESPRQTHVGHKLQGGGVIPDIDHIGLSPPVCHSVIVLDYNREFVLFTDSLQGRDDKSAHQKGIV